MVNLLISYIPSGYNYDNNTELTMSVSLFHIYVYDGSVFYKIVIGGKERVEEKEQDNRSKVQALSRYPQYKSS